MSLFRPSKNNKCARVSGVRLSLKNQRVVWENIASKNHCFGFQKKSSFAITGHMNHLVGLIPVRPESL